MSDPGGKNSPAILNAFLKLYLEDQEAGQIRPLAEYQERFPGYEAQVAERYESLQGSGDTSAFKEATLDLPDQDEAETQAAPSSGKEGDGGAPADSSQQPLQIGPYRLMRPLGEGGMGIVYLAAQTEPIKRQVALKLVRSGLTSEEFLVRFEAERQAIALMNHVNIAKVFDAGTTPDGNPYFAMEYAPGMPLKSYCEKEKLGLGKRLDLFLQICDGVRHAHQKGIIHRDLKPSNILVGNEGEKPVVKIIDFGVARSMDQRLTDKPLETEAGQMVGTPEYMSPEQAEMGPAGIDTRTDVYALGVILYELICGLLPFDSETLRGGGYTEMRWLICEADPPKPSLRLREFTGGNKTSESFGLSAHSLERKLYGDLDWITMKAIDKDRGQRYQSAGELAEDIQRYLVHDPVLAGPPTLGYKLKKFMRKHRTGILSLAALVLISTVIAALTWQAGIRETRQQRIQRSSSRLEQAKKNQENYLALSRKLQTDARAWELQKSQHPGWLPVWHPATAQLFESRQDLDDTHSQLDSEFAAALRLLFQARQEAPANEEPLLDRIRKNTEEIYANRGRQGLRQRDKLIPADSFIEEPPKSQQLSITLRSEPPGAKVHLYRYVEQEFRRLPLPYHPEKDETVPDGQLLDRAVLEFEAIHDPELYAAQFQEGDDRFAPGDRFLAIGGKPLRSRTELADELGKLAAGKSITVQVLRSGEKQSVTWTPFPAGRTAKPGELLPQVAAELKPGRLLNIHHQLGFTFSGSPLSPGPDNLLGMTPIEKGGSIKLPRGSYLAVLQLEGRPPVKIPIVVPGSEAEMTVRVPEKLPAGFVYIAAGTFFAGGDDQSQARQNLEPFWYSLPGFFISRLEVSFGDYLRFLNDAEVLARTDAKGTIEPLADRSELTTQGLTSNRSRVLLIPHYNGQALFGRTANGDWGRRSVVPVNGPLCGISMLAALEYAHWYTGSQSDGFTYRLPTDLEWEKAARGVDGRTHVWGEQPVGSFCRSESSRLRDFLFPESRGVFPNDESVYGVRDLAGSVLEPTTSRTIGGYVSFRGGWYGTADDYLFHASTRFGRPASRVQHDAGIRLVGVRGKK